MYPLILNEESEGIKLEYLNILIYIASGIFTVIANIYSLRHPRLQERNWRYIPGQEWFGIFIGLIFFICAFFAMINKKN